MLIFKQNCEENAREGGKRVSNNSLQVGLRAIVVDSSSKMTQNAPKTQIIKIKLLNLNN